MSYPNPGGPSGPGSPGGPAAQQPWAAPTEQAWAPAAPAVNAYWVNVVPGRVKGRVTEFRDSVLLQMNEGGITVEGEAVSVSSSILMNFFFRRSLIAEYAMREKKALPIPWGDVETVRLDPRTQKGVVCYHLPNALNPFFSLGFKITDPGAFQHFAHMARAFAPGKVDEDKIKGANPTLVALIIIAVSFVAVFVIAALASGGH